MRSACQHQVGALRFAAFGGMNRLSKDLVGGYIGGCKGLYWGYIGIMEKNMETTIV